MAPTARRRPRRARQSTTSRTPQRTRRSPRPGRFIATSWRRLAQFRRRQPKLAVISLTAAAAVLLIAALSAAIPEGWPRRMMVTAYCPCTECCGPNAQGITASGRPVSANGTKFVAADPELPFGTMLVIPGYNNGRPVEVLDRGGAIRGDRLDVYFPTHEEARRWGRQLLMVQRLEGKGGGTRRAAHTR